MVLPKTIATDFVPSFFAASLACQLFSFILMLFNFFPGFYYFFSMLFAFRL